MPAKQQTQLLELLEQAKLSGQRRVLVIAGNRQWGRERALALGLVERLPRLLMLSDTPLLPSVACVGGDKAKQYLGREFDGLIVDAFAGINPDALAAVTGTVVAGGIVVLLLPALAEWPSYNDPDYKRILVHPFKLEQLTHHFLQRLTKSISSIEGALVIQQEADTLVQSPLPMTHSEHPQPLLNGCKTLDQQRAVDEIIHVAKGHRKRPLVIQADRGRGKSAALGIASRLLLKGSLNHIVVLAPHVEATSSLFEQAVKGLNIVKHRNGYYQTEQGTIEFIAPDHLIRQAQKVDLLLIDEAAAIPLTMLETLLGRYSRIVFASTVHGYEGTGRGFALRFKQLLDKKAPQWTLLEMHAPIRWQQGDPVEAWLNHTLLLDANLHSDLGITGEQQAERHIIHVDRTRLARDGRLLESLYALLVLAHYQTSPNDLRNILDGPNVSVWVMLEKGRLIAVALVTDEGGFSVDMAKAVWRGERRFRGHLLPQTLAAHSGLERAPRFKYRRIMRIAVNPELQGQGIGSLLLNHIKEDARESSIDILGTSFAVTPEVLHFWRKAGLHPVRLGVSRDASSGMHSAIVLKGLSKQGRQTANYLRGRFLQQFPHQIMTLFQGLEPEVLVPLFFASDLSQLPELDDQDWADVMAFYEGYRAYEVCSLPVWKLVCRFMGQLDMNQWLSDQQRDLLVYLVLQNRPVPWIVKKLGFDGRKMLIVELRNAVKRLSQQQVFLRSTLLH